MLPATLAKLDLTALIVKITLLQDNNNLFLIDFR